MIKFFRHIRRSLIQKNKTGPKASVGRMGKYFTYAIGEIILVVIGILIALQINNWNENSKQKNVETSYLQRLLVDLNEDKKLWETIYERKSTQIDNAYKLMDVALTNKETDTVRLASFMGYLRPAITWINITTNQSTYTELLSSGNLDLIKNDSIKIRLLELDTKYKRIEKWSEIVERDHIKIFDALSSTLNATNSIVLDEDFKKRTGRKFTISETQANIVALEKDFKELFSKNMFITPISGMVDNHKRQLPLFKELENDIETLIKLVELELSNR